MQTRKGYGAPLELGGSVTAEGGKKPSLHRQVNASHLWDGKRLSQCKIPLPTGWHHFRDFVPGCKKRLKPLYVRRGTEERVEAT